MEPRAVRWLFERVGRGRCPIINCSGGTEIGACFLSPTPAMPIKACSSAGPALGMDDGRRRRGRASLVEQRRGRRARLPQAVPRDDRGFWRDPERYLDTYWRRIPGVWVHGDWASADADGYWFLHGRSDDTLNIAGKRIGPAELESAAVSHPAVREAAAVGVPARGEGRDRWIFCCLLPGEEPSAELAAEIAAAVAGELGKAFAPGRVVLVAALPKTR